MAKNEGPLALKSSQIKSDPAGWLEGLKNLVASRSKNGKLPPSGKRDEARVLIFQESEYLSQIKRIEPQLSAWDWEQVLAKPTQAHRFSGQSGPLWLVKIATISSQGKMSHEGFLASSSYSKGRDLGGVLSAFLVEENASRLSVDFIDGDKEMVLGLLVGLELGAYRFQRIMKRDWPPKTHLQVTLKGVEIPEELVTKAWALATATNLSRHFVNLPPNWLHPQSYADAIKGLFASMNSVEVDIWDEKRLNEAGMGLLTAVGAGANSAPCLVHLRYRPEQPTNQLRRPLAFVGKGITFDSGGLDIKPSSAMRLMKKDMGGSASLVGLAWWAAMTQIGLPCDFYLALAENAISSLSFRPGDILQGRNGQKIEIHNTDAEGRLVLADALDLAVNPVHGEIPQVVIDVATLTGAIKAALGADVAGMFSNDDTLAAGLWRSSQLAGDLVWRMPLYQPYRSQLNSAVAERTNAVDGFGGAITAALFLESFIGKVPWAHFDIYAWKDKPDGVCMEAGGSGQIVQCLAHWLEAVNLGEIFLESDVLNKAGI
jgi:leucyl aminopeptidase